METGTVSGGALGMRGDVHVPDGQVDGLLWAGNGTGGTPKPIRRVRPRSSQDERDAGQTRSSPALETADCEKTLRPRYEPQRDREVVASGRLGNGASATPGDGVRPRYDKLREGERNAIHHNN